MIVTARFVTGIIQNDVVVMPNLSTIRVNIKQELIPGVIPGDLLMAVPVLPSTSSKPKRGDSESFNAVSPPC
jgi:hypothetical protein